MEAVIPTGTVAHDQRRKYFVGAETGWPWDLNPAVFPITYEVIGPASDGRRVLVRGSDGQVSDVTAEKAAELAQSR